MEVAPLPSIFLCLSSVCLCLRLGLVVLILSIFYLSFSLWVGVALPWILLWGVHGYQIVTSFVWASAQFWWHIGRSRRRMRCTKILFRSGCIYAKHHDIWAPDVTLNIWYPSWCTSYGRYFGTLTLLGLFLATVWSIWYTGHHNFQKGSIVP